MTGVSSGEVTLRDFEAYFEAIASAGANHYRKLFDGTEGTSSLTEEEILSLGARIRSYHLTGRMGPLAIVMGPSQSEGFARVLGALAAADRPMRLFGSSRAAHRWLQRQEG